MKTAIKPMLPPPPRNKQEGTSNKARSSNSSTHILPPAHSASRTWELLTAFQLDQINTKTLADVRYAQEDEHLLKLLLNSPHHQY